MKNPDKYFLFIIIGAVLLVLVTLVVVVNQPQADYQVEDTPENIVHNYLLALRRLDYVRAAGYLAECLDHYPKDSDEFSRQVSREKWNFDQLQQDSAMTIQDAIVSDDRATVRVVQRYFYNNGIFNSSEYSDEFTMALLNTQSGWRLVMGDRYWLPDQWKPDDCP